MDAREPNARYLNAVEPPLVRRFELLAGAPGGVARLRELILTLAVQGQLVLQEPCDESASALLARSRGHMYEKMMRGEAKKEKPASEVDDSEKTFATPNGWQWCRLTDTGEYVNGLAFKPSDWHADGLPIIRIQNLSGRSADFNRTKGDFGPSVIVRAGDILVSWSATLDAFIWQGETGVLNQHIFRVEPAPCVDRSFLYWLLKWAIKDLADSDHAHGLVMSHINRGPFLAKPVLLPPLVEQARIVARVDELMSLCDALEAKGRLEAERHARLLGTLLGTLTDSSTPEELAANWQRVADHFDLLLDRPEAVDALEQTILQLAVRGLLVPQDPGDESATALIEQIRSARAAQLAESSRRRTRIELPGVEEDEWPFDPPPGWVWTRFGEVTQVSGGVTLGRKGAIASPLSLPYLRVANVQRWNLVLDSMKDIVIDESELSRYQLAYGDLLITEGGDWDKVGRTTIWRSELPACLHQNHVFKARGYTTTWNPSWAELYLNLDIARAYFAASAKQTTNLASINMTELRHCAFPLPPLNEQARIVARVTELRRLCFDLRQRLAASQAAQRNLVDALVEQATP